MNATDREAEKLQQMQTTTADVVNLTPLTSNPQTKTVTKRRGERNVDMDLLAGLVSHGGELRSEGAVEVDDGTCTEQNMRQSQPTKTPITPRRLNFKQTLSSRTVEGDTSEDRSGSKQLQFKITADIADSASFPTGANECKPPKDRDRARKWKKMASSLREKHNTTPNEATTPKEDSWSGTFQA